MRGPLILVFLAVATLIIFFGGTWLYFQALAELMILAAALWAFWRGEIPERNPRLYIIPGFLLLVPILQLIPLPLPWLIRFSPELGHALADLPKYGIPSPAWHCLSYNPYNTQEQLLWFFTLILAFFVMRRAAQRDPQGIRYFVIGLLALATADTLYGLYEWRNPDPYILWLPRRFYQGDVAGTYVNRNHYAGMIELILPLGLAWALDRLPELPAVAGPWPRRLKERLRQIMDATPSRLPLLLVCGLLFAGDVASHSRGGLISLTVAIIVMLLVRFARTPRRVLSALAVLLVAGGIFVKAVGVDTEMLRFDRMKTVAHFDSGGRIENWKATLPLVPKHWLLGTGLGTWQDATLRYQVTGFFDHAHNDYLELSLTGGIPLSLTLFAVLVGVGMAVGRTPADHSRGKQGSLPWLGLGISASSAALLLHSLADFNLQIPANALLVGTALSFVRREGSWPPPHNSPDEGPRSPRGLVWAIAPLLTLFVGCCVLHFGLSDTLGEVPDLLLARPYLASLSVARNATEIGALGDLRQSGLLTADRVDERAIGRGLQSAPFALSLWEHLAGNMASYSGAPPHEIGRRLLALRPRGDRH